MEKKTISHVIGLTIVIALAISVFFHVRDELNQGSAASSSTRNEYQAPDTLEYKLAAINSNSTLPADHYSIREFKHLLSDISRKCPNSKREISDISVACYQELNKTEKTTLLKVMKDLEVSIPSDANFQINFAEIAALYLTLKSSNN